jgi:hypothetical protein
MLFGCIFLGYLSKIMLAPIVVDKLMLIGMVAVMPLVITYRQILHDYVQPPEEKSALQVYEGKVYFSFGRKGGGTIWKIHDKQGKLHTLFCAMSGSLSMMGCYGGIDKKNFKQYQGKQVIVHYSEKFGIMEASIEGEKIYDYDEQKKWFTRPLGGGKAGKIDYAIIWFSVIFFVVFIKECLKNLDLLIDYFSNLLRWRRQMILRHTQLSKEKDAQNV